MFDQSSMAIAVVDHFSRRGHRGATRHCGPPPEWRWEMARSQASRRAGGPHGDESNHFVGMSWENHRKTHRKMVV